MILLLKIVICYELVDKVFEIWYEYYDGDYTDEDYEYLGYCAHDVLSYVLLHEVAHAIIHIYDLPVTGLEENAADQFAALILSYTYAEDTPDDFTRGQDMLYHVGNFYWFQSEIQPSVGSFWDVHNLDIQRFYNISCYSYGADPKYNQDLIDDESLPEDRALGCEYEFHQIKDAWSYMLKDFTNGFFDDN